MEPVAEKPVIEYTLEEEEYYEPSERERLLNLVRVLAWRFCWPA